MKIILRYINILILAALVSCNSLDKVVYFQDVDLLTHDSVYNDYELKIKKDDILSISVSSKNPEVVKIFNMTSVNNVLSGNSSGVTKSIPYTVDVNGCINFPILGTIKVEGMTRKELEKHIKKIIVDNDYVKDPIVTVQFLNFKISVLGEVNKPGCYEIGSERITLLEAIGKAGDLTIYGKRDKVAVIREADGKRTVLYHDLRSSEIFESPCYYLQQNDVVYVEPNKSKASQQGRFGNTSLWISILSVTVSIVSVLLLR